MGNNVTANKRGRYARHMNKTEVDAKKVLTLQGMSFSVITTSLDLSISRAVTVIYEVRRFMTDSSQIKITDINDEIVNFDVLTLCSFV